MNDTAADARLTALLGDTRMLERDPAWARQIAELAAHDLRLRHARRRAIGQVCREATGLLSAIALFVMLARIGPPAGMGDALSLSSPAMFGVVLLSLLGVVGGKGSLSVLR